MCRENPPHDYSEKLYDKYREAIEEYMNSMVLPALREKHDDEYMLLRELVKRLSSYKVMVSFLSRIFRYLDCYFVPRRSLPPVEEVGMTCFRDLVYNQLQRKVREAVIALVSKEREGEEIDRALMINVKDFYVEIGMGNMERYKQDFERFMLEDTASYYSRKASSWIQEDSFLDYIRKSEECIKKEKERVNHYLHPNSEPKLVKEVEHELLVVYANKLLEKKHSEFCEIVRGLEPIANIFKQHVTDAGGKEDTATNQEQVLIRKVIELHDKYMVYVTECFQNHKALKEAFEVLRSKTVAGNSSSAELLATFCDRIILKKWRSEELSDEAIE